MTTKKISYPEKLRDPRWQKKRLCVMQRDGFACRDCGDADSTLHVHHCHYEKGDPWQTRDIFLLTLCSSCHERRGEVEQLAKEAFHVTMAHMPIDAIDVKLKQDGYDSFISWGLAAVQLMTKIKGRSCEKQLIEWRSRRNSANAHTRKGAK